MDSTFITLHTNTRNSFNCTDGYENVSISELSELHRMAHEIANSLEGELMRRQPSRVSTKSGVLGTCCQRLHETAREVRVRGHVDGKLSSQVADVASMVMESQTSQHNKVYHTFLRDCIRQCNPGMAFLCAASLGKKNVFDLGNKGRVDLLEYLGDAQHSLDSPALKDLTKVHQIPCSASKCSAHFSVCANNDTYYRH